MKKMQRKSNWGISNILNTSTSQILKTKYTAFTTTVDKSYCSNCDILYSIAG